MLRCAGMMCLTARPPERSSGSRRWPPGLFGVPISIVSIVDTDRVWFKSHHGLDADQTSRAPGLCASAIVQDGPWLVTDAATDPLTGQPSGRR